jgi:hypothetical protein
VRAVLDRGHQNHDQDSSPMGQHLPPAPLLLMADDIVETKPELRPLWDLLRATVKRSL